MELARSAGELTLRWFQSDALQVDRKDDGSPVTEADRAAEALLRRELAERFPEDAVVGEEESATAGSSGRTWIIDPIDGTRSFTHGVPLYTTLLAMFDEEGPALGVACVPALGETVWAGRGLGCYHDGQRCEVSRRDGLERAYVCTSGLEWWPNDVPQRVADSGARVRTWGDGYGYVLVATGRVDAMVDPGLNLWDIAPMLVIVPEAGGRISRWSGDDQPGAGDWLASNSRLHDELLGLLGGE